MLNSQRQQILLVSFLLKLTASPIGMGITQTVKKHAQVNL